MELIIRAIAENAKQNLRSMVNAVNVTKKRILPGAIVVKVMNVMIVIILVQ